MNQRKIHIDRFYSLMNELEEIQPKRILTDSNGRMNWFDQGVYFFCEKNEVRKNSKPRIVRIGTHAVSQGSKTKLWKRLRQHKGTQKGEGNHRSSVFRRLIGFALINKQNLNYPFWGVDKKLINNQIKDEEKTLEIDVSRIIGVMPFLCLQVLGDSSKDNMRAYIETNSIALLSNRNKERKIDPPLVNWLGKYSGQPNVVESGLWNSDDTEKVYNPKFLDKLEGLISNMRNNNVKSN